MKLETAYRKLARHKKKWIITVEHDGYNHPIVKAYLKIQYLTLWLPAELRGSTKDEHGTPYWPTIRRGHANAVNAMADKLDRVELAITKHREAVEAAKEASR